MIIGCEIIFITTIFDNFNDIDLTVLVKQGPNDEKYTADVVNRRIGFKLVGMSLTGNN